MTSQIAGDGSVHAPNCPDPDACIVYECGDRVQRVQSGVSERAHTTMRAEDGEETMGEPVRCTRFTTSSSSCLRPVVPGTTRCKDHLKGRVSDVCSTCLEPIGVICLDTSIHFHHYVFVPGVGYGSGRQHCPGRPDQRENR